MEGWIKLYRKTLDNPIITKDSDHLAVWVYLLVNATHQEYDALFKGKRITLKRGQLITGTISIAKKLKVNKDKVQRILKLFENDKQIEQQTSNKNRLISILNWDKYQEVDEQNDKQLINKCETTNKQVITNKNVKNIKNIKNDKNVTTTIIDDSCVDGLQEVIDFYSNNIGFLNPYGLKILESYAKDLSSELVIYAMQISVENNKKTISYIKAILNNWTKANIKTLEEAKRENKKKVNTDKQIEQRNYTEDEFESLYAN